MTNCYHLHTKVASLRGHAERAISDWIKQHGQDLLMGAIDGQLTDCTLVEGRLGEGSNMVR